VTSYGYDNDSELTGLTYMLNSNTLGTLTYSYDMGGRRTTVGGTYARTGLPNAQATTAMTPERTDKMGHGDTDL